ncbi:Pdc2p-like protein, partial [Dinothrombium tinctorium]
MIVAKGRKLAQEMKINEDELSFSSGWLSCFKKRNGIKIYRVCGESGSIDNQQVAESLPILIETISQFDKSDIFNIDETALFYRMEPDLTLATKRIAGLVNKDASISDNMIEEVNSEVNFIKSRISSLNLADPMDISMFIEHPEERIVEDIVSE